MNFVTIKDPGHIVAAVDFDRKYLNDSVDEIDAAMFSGDPFYEAANRELMRSFLCRWARKLDEIEAELKDGAAT